MPKVLVTVIGKKCFPDLQEQYLSHPQVGPCDRFEVGDEFLFEGFGGPQEFWRMEDGRPRCTEVWDCIGRYVYAALQGGSIMKGWTNDEKMMIACCNDGTRPVIFKIQRIDDGGPKEAAP